MLCQRKTIKHVVLSVRCTVHTTANRSCSTQYTEVNIWAIVYSSWFPACPALSVASAAPPRPAPPCPLRPPARPFAPSASPPALACKKNGTAGAARSERSVFFALPLHLVDDGPPGGWVRPRKSPGPPPAVLQGPKACTVSAAHGRAAERRWRARGSAKGLGRGPRGRHSDLACGLGHPVRTEDVPPQCGVVLLPVAPGVRTHLRPMRCGLLRLVELRVGLDFLWFLRSNTR